MAAIKAQQEEKEKEEAENEEESDCGEEEAERRLAVGSQHLEVGSQIDGPIVFSVVVRHGRPFVL